MDDDYDDILTLLKDLEKARIFDRKTRWFRHELIQKCFEAYLSEGRKKNYHLAATQLYKDRMKVVELSIDKRDSPIDSNAFAYGYHLANTDSNFDASYDINHKLAIRLSLTGNLDKAERCFKRAIHSAKKLNRKDLEMAVLSNVTAYVYAIWGNYQEALTNYLTLEKYYHTSGQIAKEGDILNEIGKIYEKTDRNDDALSYYQKSLTLFEKIGDDTGKSFSLNQIGTYYAKKKYVDKALEYYEKSLKIKKRIRKQV